MVMGPITGAATGGGKAVSGKSVITTDDDGWMERFLTATAEDPGFVRQACSDRVRALLRRGTGVVATALFELAFVWDDEARDWVETQWAAGHIDAMVGSLRSSR